MRLEVIGQNPWERADPRNPGVLADELVATSQGVYVRRVIYRCPISAEEYRYLTNVNDVPPGLIAHLYRARWEIEPSGANRSAAEIAHQISALKMWAKSLPQAAHRAEVVEGNRGDRQVGRAAPAGAGKRCSTNSKTNSKKAKLGPAAPRPRPCRRSSYVEPIT
jgi:hypothetical protein